MMSITQTCRVVRFIKAESGRRPAARARAAEHWEWLSGYKVSPVPGGKRSGDWFYNNANCTQKDGQDGKFYVMYFLPQ